MLIDVLLHRTWRSRFSKLKMTDEDDELERLLNSYSAEAAKQNQRLEAKASRKAQPRKEKVVREAGLQQPLDACNKGYVLLRKMGYQDGKGLGSAGSGRAEPLPLDLKPGRAGVGVDEQRKREQEEKQLQEELERAKRARLVSEVQQRYTDTARSGYNARQMVRHLRGAWRVAEQLDERAAAEYDQAGMAADGGAGAGPDGRAAARDVAESEAGPGAAGVPRSTVLQALLAQLPVLAAMLGEEEAEGQGHGLAGQAGGAAERREAITCSERISQREEAEEEEEEEEAPRASAGDEGSAGEAAEGVSAREACGGAGPALVGTRVDGGARPGGRSGGGGGVGAGGGGGAGAGGPSLAGAGDDAAGDAAGAAPSLAQQLDVLLLHLRERHCYCYFCGCQYDTPDDLASSCPGLSEEDH
ncbi:hypothetical protein PLESTF_001459700 [Pleodorina starrii]|nr:hypothetical protein PLESTF_001459700 [Pleodorina starrii]